jgi:hypothetical protein
VLRRFGSRVRGSSISAAVVIVADRKGKECRRRFYGEVFLQKAADIGKKSLSFAQLCGISDRCRQGKSKKRSVIIEGGGSLFVFGNSFMCALSSSTVLKET